MRNTHFGAWKYGWGKLKKGGKFRNVHCGAWNMARKTENHGK